MAFSADGKEIAITSGIKRNGWLQVRAVDTGRVRLSIPLADHLVDTVAFSPDGELLVAGIGAGDSMRDTDKIFNMINIYN